jgi:hypothetical protein
MARQVFVLTALLTVLITAGRVGTNADSPLDGPIIPMPLAEAAGPRRNPASNTQGPADGAAPGNPTVAASEPVSSIAMPGTAFKLLYLFGHDSNPANPSAVQAEDKPVSVILWKALDIGAKVSVRDIRERIAETSASPSMTGKAAYALLPDYKLQRLSLTNQEIDHLFELIKAGSGEAIASDAVWKGKIAGQLKEVEWLDDGTQKNKKNKYKSKSPKSKATKSGKPSKVGKAAKAPKIARGGKASKPAKTTADASSRSRRN